MEFMEEAQEFFEQSNENDNAASQGSSLLKNSRKGFVRKVFSILAAQLTLTAAFVVAGQTSHAFRSFQIHHEGVLILSAVMTLIIFLCLFFVESLSQRVPHNYLLLTLSTICQAYSLSAVTLGYEPTLVLKAALLTATATLVTLAYAMTTKKDVSLFGSLVFILALGTPIVSLLNFFVFRSSFIEILIHIAGVAICCFYLVYDVQQVIGSKRFRHGLDNYILGALMIYADIIQLFIRILQILAKLQSNEEEEKDKKKRR